jgi:hypothetical protein
LGASGGFLAVVSPGAVWEQQQLGTGGSVLVGAGVWNWEPIAADGVNPGGGDFS